MKQDQFDVELERYLHARRRPKVNVREFLGKFWRGSKPDRIDPETGVEIYDKPSVMQRVKEKKDSVVAHFSSHSTAPTEDMKEVAKIALGVIRQLPDEELRKFKQSSDFEKLKEILKKHELIKE